MPTPTEDSQKSSKDPHLEQRIDFRVDDNRKKLFEEFMQKSKLNKTDTARAIFDGFFLSGLQKPTQRTPEKCRQCIKCAGEIESGVVCLTKKSPSDPVTIKIFPFAISEKCADTPFNTPVNKKTKEQYDKEIAELRPYKEKHASLLTENENLYRDNVSLQKLKPLLRKAERELEQVKQPFQVMLKEKEGLKIELGTARNSLLAAFSERDALQTDNEYLRTEKAKLSENKLLDENDSLMKRLNQANKDQDDVKEEVEKLQALIKEERNRKSDIVSRVDRMLREIDQFIPRPSNQLSVADLELKAYTDSLKKTIQNFRGYLQTVAS